MKQVITVRRRKYATGLFWQPVNPGVTPYLYARQLVAKSDKKYTLLTEYKSMIGLAESRDGVRSGMNTAAAEVMNAFPEFSSFLGVFRVDNRFYLVAVRNGVIIRDVLVEKESDARKLYAELSNMPDWGALFAPSSWGMPRSQEKFLQDIVKNESVARLRQISIVKSVAPSIVLFLILLGVGLYFLYSPLFKSMSAPKSTGLNPELMAEYQKQLEAKNQELDKEFEIVKSALVYPYDNLPDVMERARLCYKATGFVMQPVMGWDQKNTMCDEEHVSVVFTRDFGTLNDFYLVGGDVMPGGIVHQVSDNEIRVRAKLPALKTHSSVDERDQETAMRDIVSVFQQVNMKAGIRASNEIIRNNKEKATVNFIEVSASSKLVPSEFMQIFNDFDGVYMKSVGWDARDRIWNYNVVIYTK
jgi:hypothetical protein